MRPLGFACALALLLAVAAPAQEPPVVVPQPPEKGAFFFEVTAHSLSFSQRDLYGGMVVGDADQVFYIPRVKSGIGFGFGFGRRLRSGLWSISYLVSGHDAAFQGRDSTAVSHLLQINSRSYLLKTDAFKLFAHFGLIFPWLTVRDDVADTRGVIHDATYLGIGVNAGGGVMLPVSSRMFFSASLIYRLIGYLYAKGPVKGIDVTDLFDDVSGPRHQRYLRAPALALELSLGYEL
ncbi:MAG TPA: hypothetical protein VF451_01840 [Acidobacteriota bacterium]